jgi:hypothetical protein
MRKIKLITISLIFSVMLGIAPVTIAVNSDIIATPTTHLLSFDGSLVDVVAAFTINNENYFKLRDIALLVNSFDVTYDSEKSAISIISDVPYTPNGTESTAKPSGYTTISPSTDKVYIGVICSNGLPNREYKHRQSKRLRHRRTDKRTISYLERGEQQKTIVQNDERHLREVGATRNKAQTPMNTTFVSISRSHQYLVLT